MVAPDTPRDVSYWSQYYQWQITSNATCAAHVPASFKRPVSPTSPIRSNIHGRHVGQSGACNGATDIHTVLNNYCTLTNILRIVPTYNTTYMHAKLAPAFNYSSQQLWIHIEPVTIWWSTVLVTIAKRPHLLFLVSSRPKNSSHLRLETRYLPLRITQFVETPLIHQMVLAPPVYNTSSIGVWFLWF